jgi:hypothetical protein
MKIICRHKSPEAKKAVQQAYKTWINQEIKKWYSRRDNLSLHQKLIHSDLSYKCSVIEFDIIDQNIRREVHEEIHNHYLVLRKKLQKLVTCKSSLLCTNNEPPPVTFYNRVKNLTDITFNQNEINMLEKGLKYCPSLGYNKKDLELLAINTELALNTINNTDHKDFEKITCASIINKFKNTKQNNFVRPTERNVINSIKQKIVTHDLVLCKADKSNTVTILDRQSYTEKTESLIKNKNFIELTTDPTNKFNNDIKKLINKCKNIFTDNDKWKLTQMNPASPILYGLPKLHKINYPMRPVVSYVTAPAYKVCKKLNSIIPSLINFNPTYAIKNSLQLVEKIKNIKLPPNAKLISFDIVNLFPSIPKKELLSICLDQIKNSTSMNNNQKQELYLCIDTCINQSYLQFNNKFYNQLDGLPMGSPLSPLLSEIFMSSLESKIFHSNNKLINKVFYWARYVDDIFCIWLGTDRQLMLFQSFLNSFYKQVQFTLEIEKSNSLNFLDLTISKKQQSLEFQIYRKPTFTDTIVHAQSIQSHSIKLSNFHSMIHRLLTLPLRVDNYKNEVNILKNIAKNNGYDHKLIDKLIYKKQRKLLQKQFYSINEHTTTEPYHSINFIPNITNKINNRLKRHNLKPISVNKNNLGSLLVNNKEKQNKLQKSGVYQINCAQCEAIYIGQSGRAIKKRILEHKRAILNNIFNSGFSEHCIKQNHFLDTHNIKLLHPTNKGKRLDLLEILEIKKAQKQNKYICNDQIDFNISPLLKTVI